MKHSIDNDDIYKGFLGKRFNISSDQLSQINDYCIEIKNWSGRQNLVSKNDLGHLYERHVLPSAFLTEIIKDEPAKIIADIGSGSGFPGIIIKILLPEKSVYLTDSSRKKYLFLLELCEKLKVDCKIINERIENLARSDEIRFDLIVSRAVAPLATLWRWSEKSLTQGGSLYVFKGGNIDLEFQQIEKMDLNITIIQPGSEWQSMGNMGKNKFLVHIRRKNGHG